MVDINFQCIEVTYGHTVKWQLNPRPAHANMLTDTHEYMHTIVLFVIFDCQPTLFNRLMRPRRPKLSKILKSCSDQLKTLKSMKSKTFKGEEFGDGRHIDRNEHITAA